MIARTISLSLLMAALLWLGSQPAGAAILQNTIDPEAMLDESGEQLLASVQLSCDVGELVQVRVTFNQRSTGAVAEGQTYGHCTGEVVHLPVVLASMGPAAFVPGEANGCALAISFTRAAVTDAHQWCRAEAVTLLAGGWPHMSLDRGADRSPDRGWRDHHRH